MLFVYEQQYKFSITEEEYERCRDFAEKSTNDYWKRNQNDPENIKRQIVFGKMGEIVAAKFIHRCLKHPPMEPDFRIYDARTKGWDSDFPYKTLGTGKRNIHVKSYTLSDKPESWAFQYANKNGNGGTDRLFSEYERYKNDAVICVLVDVDERVGYIRVVGDWKAIRGLLREPVSHKLKGLKKFLYYDDLLDG